MHQAYSELLYISLNCNEEFRPIVQGIVDDIKVLINYDLINIQQEIISTVIGTVYDNLYNLINILPENILSESSKNDEYASHSGWYDQLWEIVSLVILIFDAFVAALWWVIALAIGIGGASFPDPFEPLEILGFGTALFVAILATVGAGLDLICYTYFWGDHITFTDWEAGWDSDDKDTLFYKFSTLMMAAVFPALAMGCSVFPGFITNPVVGFIFWLIDLVGIALGSFYTLQTTMGLIIFKHGQV